MPLPAPKTSAKHLAANALRGFAMGTADLVPGVSGGTIALLLGIYDLFIQSIAQISKAIVLLLRGRFRPAQQQAAQVAWRFVLPLGVGIVAAVFSLAPVMRWLLEHYPEELAGAFCGVLAASVVSLWRQSRDHPGVQLNWFSWASWPHWIVAAAVAVGLFALLGISAEPHSSLPLAAFFGSGALAICAMTLPGISGAFLLLIIGMYGAVINAVSDFAIAEIVVLLAGAGVGLVIFAPLLRRCLERFPRATYSVLLGLLLGSVRVLWPWPDGVGIISRDTAESVDGTRLDWPSWGDLWLPALLGLVCFAAISWAILKRPRAAV